jgi:ring-1,2-phenylacetyl-CoA epoxidase subunit PaaD
MTREQVYNILREVTDPEIPVITIEELGILRNVEVDEDGSAVTVFITPTYNGCPAMDMIASEIKETLAQHHISRVSVISLIEPVWTTDWITEAGRQKLLDYGIAPPVEKTTDTSFLTGKSPVVACPLCRSGNTALVSRFGSTPCKALYKCGDCLEPFDYFKCH